MNSLFISLHLWASTVMCAPSVYAFLFFLFLCIHHGWVCLVCVLGVESPTQLSEFSPDWPQKERERWRGENSQQISGIRVLITLLWAKTGFKSIRSIMLNYAWPDADLVAFIMLKNQPKLSFKLKIRVSFVQWGEKRFVVGTCDGGSRHPLTWLRVSPWSTPQTSRLLKTFAFIMCRLSDKHVWWDEERRIKVVICI